MPSSFFITKNRSEIPTLDQWSTENDFSLQCNSFLSFESVTFTVKKNFDIVFFSSPRSVRFFFSSEKNLTGKKIAVVGKATKAEVLKFHPQVDFELQTAGEIEKSVEEFKNWAGNQKILFPISNISNKSFSSVFGEKQKEEIVVYSTIITPKTIKNTDVYIFTSPSNVRGFIAKNNLADDKIIVAWGNTTQHALEKLGLTVSYTLKTSTEQELIDLLNQL